MNKEELYELALSDVHKYNLLNEIFAIRDKNIENVNYTIGVDGFISLDVLNQYVNKIDENTNLKQALNKINDKLLCYGETFDSDIHKQFQRECLQIINEEVK